MLVLKGLVGLHRTVQLLQLYWLGHRLSSKEEQGEIRKPSSGRRKISNKKPNLPPEEITKKKGKAQSQQKEGNNNQRGNREKNRKDQ